jgi:Domain of unknown function (DUF397)
MAGSDGRGQSIMKAAPARRSEREDRQLGAEEINWRKSSFSGTQDCVEVRQFADRVQIRDSKNRRASALSVSSGQWHAFVAGLRSGGFEPAGPVDDRG